MLTDQIKFLLPTAKRFAPCRFESTTRSSKEKEPFEPVAPGKVGIYLCGPTVYKPSHIGHMVGPVIFDTIKRYLTYCGYEVTLVVNITDVDDKLIAESSQPRHGDGRAGRRDDGRLPEQPRRPWASTRSTTFPRPPSTSTRSSRSPRR